MTRSAWSVCSGIVALALGLAGPARAVDTGCGHAHAIRFTALKTRCARHSPSACRVIFSGVVRGSERFSTLYYQQADVGGSDSNAVIFSRGPDDNLHPIGCIYYYYASYSFETTRAEVAPRIYSTRFGPLFDLPAREVSDGQQSDHLLFLWRHGQWRPIETDSWKRALDRRIARDWFGADHYSVGIPDLTGSAEVFKNPGPNVSFGRADFHFEIRQDRLELVSVRVKKDPDSR
jgi:hypothetical protein